MPGICPGVAGTDGEEPERWKGQPGPERSSGRVSCPPESQSSWRESRLVPLAEPGEEVSCSSEELEARARGEQG